MDTRRSIPVAPRATDGGENHRKTEGFMARHFPREFPQYNGEHFSAYGVGGGGRV